MEIYLIYSQIMELDLRLDGTTYSVALNPLDISIPLIFNGPQPNTYGVPQAVSEAFEGGGFVGDVRRGGSCNFETYQFTPHCNGTHTECIGHIAEARIPVHSSLGPSFIPSTLITVNPTPAEASRDSYDPPLAPQDMVIDVASLQEALPNGHPEFLEALVIRTTPNDPSKRSRDYMKTPPPFFSWEAMKLIRSWNVTHLLVDMPSVDRLFDEGKLSIHHIFWGVPQGSNNVSESDGIDRTITEMIYVADDIEDGRYLLDLQIAPFVSDAAPSRPRLFRLTERVDQG
ncbi:cyclase family protein [Pontibacter sp. G13]|uniref:cyclase family protein n=1 Tax=Pontibacter sp. G13 TaxID=3074898 RepID=UPI00288A3469|nr:cyclase family protein [Pontibacter sp. G13]WNJ16182.1 cyclase family protein [Pontibacter sp. G13]